MRQPEMFATIATLSGCIAVAGCSTTGYQGMTAEQIAALAKMKDANVNCIVVNSPWGKGVTLFVNLDKGVVAQGGLSIDADCKTTVQLTTKP